MSYIDSFTWNKVEFCCINEKCYMSQSPHKSGYLAAAKFPTLITFGKFLRKRDHGRYVCDLYIQKYTESYQRFFFCLFKDTDLFNLIRAYNTKSFLTNRQYNWFFGSSSSLVCGILEAETGSARSYAGMAPLCCNREVPSCISQVFDSTEASHHHCHCTSWENGLHYSRKTWACKHLWSVKSNFTGQCVYVFCMGVYLLGCVQVGSHREFRDLNGTRDWIEKPSFFVHFEDKSDTRSWFPITIYPIILFRNCQQLIKRGSTLFDFHQYIRKIKTLPFWQISAKELKRRNQWPIYWRKKRKKKQ